MYPIQNGAPFLVQQITSGAGGFDGSDYGRAAGTIGAGSAAIRLSARLYGEAPNDYTVQLVDAGAMVVVPKTLATLSGNHLTVTLSRTSGALTATARDVAAAINGIRSGLVAAPMGTGLGLMAAYGPGTPMTGGEQPSREGAKFLWTIPENSPGGLFFFEQEEILVVRQFEASFTIASGTHSVSVFRVNLDAGLQPTLASAIPVFTWTRLTLAAPDIAFSDANVLLHPYQALQVVTDPAPLPGIVRFDVHKGSHYLYG